jgi:hypothetical protein
MVGMSHDKDKFKQLQEYLDGIPEPKWWQFKTRLIIRWSNLIDDIAIWKWNRKHKMTL